MQAKALEIRDCGTFIAALAVDMNPQSSVNHDDGGTWEAQRYLLRRCGYPCDQHPNVIVTRLDGNGHFAYNDPYDHKDRTWRIAHEYIIKHWAILKDGDVVDVEFILGETEQAKKSEKHDTF